MPVVDRALEVLVLRWPSAPDGGRTAVRSGDAVPLADRLRVTQLLRAAAVALLLLCAVLAPESLQPYRESAVAATLA